MTEVNAQERTGSARSRASEEPVARANAQALDFEGQLRLQDEAFPTLRILDNDGTLLDEAAFAQTGLGEQDLVSLMKNMVRSRQLDIRSTKLAKQGRFGFFAPTAGQEASQMASAYAFSDEDWLFPGYRDIPQIVAKGWPIWKAILWSRGHRLGNIYTTDGETGEGGGQPDKPVNSWFPQIIIGAQYTAAAGVGLGLKKRGKPAVAYAYTGDGGSSQGDFYEAMNFAGAYRANVVFIVQNNGFAISTPRSFQSAAPHLAAKGWGAGIPSLVVDGNDALAVYLAAKQARAWAASGRGPVLIETLTDRLEPHSTAGDDPLRYRTKADIDEWWAKEPLLRMRAWLEAKGLWSQAAETAYVAEVDTEIDQAIARADAVDKQKVSDLIKNTLEVPSQAMREQIDHFESLGK